MADPRRPVEPPASVLFTACCRLSCESAVRLLLQRVANAELPLRLRRAPRLLSRAPRLLMHVRHKAERRRHLVGFGHLGLGLLLSLVGCGHLGLGLLLSQRGHLGLGLLLSLGCDPFCALWDRLLLEPLALLRLALGIPRTECLRLCRAPVYDGSGPMVLLSSLTKSDGWAPRPSLATAAFQRASASQLNTQPACLSHRRTSKEG
jgi:hypothetical protein